MKSFEIFKRIKDSFAPGRAHSPCRKDDLSAAKPTPENGSPSVPISPPNLLGQSREGTIGTWTGELSTQHLDLTWRVGMLCISVEAKKLSHKYLDLPVGQVDEAQPSKGILMEQPHLENSSMSLNIQVFAAQANGQFSTSPPSQSGGSRSPQKDDASGGGETGLSLNVTRSDRSPEKESLNNPSGTGTPPVALPQLRQVLPAGHPVLSGFNWSSAPTHGFDGTMASNPYQGPSGEPGGVTMVMRLNPSTQRSDPQAGLDDVMTGSGSEGIEYDGGKRKFICEACGQPFSSKYNVRRHQQSTNAHKGDRRSGEEGIFCGQCGQKLSRPDALRRHERKGACGKRPGGSGQGSQGLPSSPPQ